MTRRRVATDALLRQVNEEWKTEASNLCLGDLIKLLETRPVGQGVGFDFCGMGIDGIGSYRGFYEDLALEPCEAGTGFRSVEQLLNRLRDAIGESFPGYKGGDFVMSVNSILWAAKSGETGSTAIVSVTGDDFRTIIETKWVGGLMP